MYTEYDTLVGPENDSSSSGFKRAVVEIDQNPVMTQESESKPRSKEVLEETSVEETIENANSRALEKSVEAIERCEFKGEKIGEAIHDYYQDHTISLALLKRIVTGSGEFSRQVSQKEPASLGIKSAELVEAVRGLAELSSLNIDKDKFSEAADEVLKMIFSEPSVGQLTLDTKTISEVADDIVSIRQALSGRGMGERASRDDVIDSIQDTIERTRKEVRPAGQLLFHNTSFADDILVGESPGLRSQAKQRQLHKEQAGPEVRWTTTSIYDDEQHGGGVHVSETYDPISYKDTHGESTGNRGVTFAVPLGRMIELAPFGRGLEYGIAEVDPKILQNRDTKDPVQDISVGASEFIGQSTGAIDRVFWASDESLDKAIMAEIPIDSDAIIIQSDNDLLNNFRSWRKGIEPGSPEYEQLQVDAKAMTERQIVEKYGGIQPDQTYGAQVVTITDREFDESHSALEAKALGSGILGSKEFIPWSDLASSARPVIEELMQKTKDRYEGSVVVPLRATSPDFMRQGDSMVHDMFGEKALERVRSAFL